MDTLHLTARLGPLLSNFHISFLPGWEKNGQGRILHLFCKELVFSSFPALALPCCGSTFEGFVQMLFLRA